LLDELGEFEALFEKFVRIVRVLVQGADGQEWPWRDALRRPRIIEADRLRIELSSLLSTVLAGSHASVPLVRFLKTSLRVADERLHDFLGVGQLTGIGDFLGGVVRADKFEYTVAECEGLLLKRRRELEAQLTKLSIMRDEAERGLTEEHARELERIRAANLSVGVLAKKIRESVLGRVFWWFFKDWTHRTVTAAVLAVLAVTVLSPLRRVAGTLSLRASPRLLRLPRQFSCVARSAWKRGCERSGLPLRPNQLP
jgi:hypothetical protein